jgi:PKD repeat protein
MVLPAFARSAGADMSKLLRALATVFVSFAGVTLIVASGGSDGPTTFSKSFGGEQNDWVAGAVPTPDGGYLLVGNRDDVPGDTVHRPGTSGFGRIWVAKLDSLGDLEWEKGYADPSVVASSSEIWRVFYRVVAAADGGAWLIGGDTSAGGDAIVVARLDASGQVSWTRTYDSSADMTLPYFYPDGTASEGNAIGAETSDGAFWIAATASAFVRDTRGGGADPALGVDMRTVYLLKLAPDGSVYASRHADFMPAGLSISPVEIRTLEDGGVAVTGVVGSDSDDYLLVADASGQVRSKTLIIDAATAGLLTQDRLTIHDFTAMRRTAIAGAAGDDGYVITGNLGDQSWVARYLANERDPDDPTEGLEHHESRPLENDWRIEIPEIVNLWAVAPLCGANTPPNRRCRVLVAGASRETPGDMLLATVDTEANISGFMRAVPGITYVCDIRQEPDLTADGHVAYRLHARDFAGGSGTLVIDDQRQVIQPFVSNAGGTCLPDTPSRLAHGGEVASLDYPGGAGQFNVSRHTTQGQPRWSVSLAQSARFWSRALAVRRVEDGFVIAGDSGDQQYDDQAAALMLKIATDGTLQWQRRVPGIRIASGAFRNFSSGLAVQPSGYLLVGQGDDNAGHALHFDAQGNLTWQRAVWGGTGNTRGTAAALRDGGWLIAGGDYDETALPLVRMDASGQISWVRTLAGLSDVDSIAETLSGELFVGGRSGTGSVVMKADASGAVAWSNRIEPQGFGNDVVLVAAQPDGGVLLATSNFAGRPEIAGATSADEAVRMFNSGDIALVKFDAGGTRAWEKRYGGAYRDVLTSLVATSDGGAVLGAASYSVGSRSDRSEGWVLRVGPDGLIAQGCAAELPSTTYLNMGYDDGGISSLAANGSSFVPGGQVTARSVGASSVTNANLSPRSVEARQCRGSVANTREPNAPQARLRVLPGNPNYSGVVSSVPAGILCGVEAGGSCEFSFDAGLTVTLTVDPGSRSHFESWTGCDTVSTDRMSCRVSLEADRTVTATFAAEPRPPVVNLIVNAVAGRGTVTGTGGMQCRAVNSGVCTVPVNRGSSAQLTAVPDTGRSFLGWDGDCAAFGSTRAITFFMSEGRTCGARFSGPPPGAPMVNLQINVPQAGTVTSDPGGIECGASNILCSEGFASGSSVTLTARATMPGYEFESFLCDGVGRVFDRSVTLENLTRDSDCQANFSPAIERLYLRIVRDLNDLTTDSHVYVEGGGLDCRYDCDRPFLRGETLILRAEPWADYVLTGWSGCGAVHPDNTHPGGNYYCQVTMDQRRDVIAFFARVRPGPIGVHSLAVGFTPDSASGRVTSVTGQIDCTPSGGVCSGSFAIGSQVSLLLESVAGSSLATHDGCDTFTPASGGNPARCVLTMRDNRAVAFGFNRADEPPAAAFTFEPIAPLTGQSVTFDARTSSDDNGIASYAWSFADNGVTDATSSVVTHTYAAAGTYTVRLTVTDTNGVSDDETHTIVVSAAPTVVLPVITLQPLSVTVSPGDAATFTVSANPGGGTLSYQWQRDGANISGATSYSYTTLPTTTADDGAIFRAVVSNSAGSVVSNSAVLTVGHGWRPVGNSLATPSYNPSLAMNAGGDIYVSHSAPLNGLNALYVRRFNGSTWPSVGEGPVDPASTYSISEHTLITGSDGYPIVAWNQGPAARVARWTGSQWVMIGSDLSIDTTDHFGSNNMQIARHGDDLVAVWTEAFGFPITEVRIAVKRYSAATGNWSGGYLPDVFYPGAIRLALDSNGLAAVAYVPRPLGGAIGAIQVMRESATGWAPLGGDVGPVPQPNSNGLAANYGVDIHFDGQDTPVVIGSADGTSIFAFGHTGSAWLPLGSANGVFVALDPATDGTSLMALVNREGYIAMAYTRSHRPPGGGTQFITEFLSWNGTEWVPLGEPLSLLNYTLSPHLDGGLNPVMAGEYGPPGGLSEVVVRRYVP